MPEAVDCNEATAANQHVRILDDPPHCAAGIVDRVDCPFSNPAIGKQACVEFCSLAGPTVHE